MTQSTTRKSAIELIELAINPSKPLVFDIMVPPGPLVDGYAYVERSKIDPTKGRLVPRLAFLVDPDAPRALRRIALVPGGYRDPETGAFNGGFIEEPTATFWRTIGNPVDGVPIGVFEVDVVATTTVEEEEKEEDDDAPIDPAKVGDLVLEAMSKVQIPQDR